MNNVRLCEVIGYGAYLSDTEIHFGDQTRYRVGPETSQLDMLVHASELAIARSGLEPGEIDCIISAAAVGAQPIPCTAALVQERVAAEAPAAAFDVNSTCTSFITALDIASTPINSGIYHNVLIAAGDVASRGLNPKQRESYELFSDAAAAVVLSDTMDPKKGVIASSMRTWPQFAHETEIRGGLGLLHARHYDTNPEDFLFDMDGRAVLRAVIQVLPQFFEDFHNKNSLSFEDYTIVIPHQASKALRLGMRLLGVAEGRYIDIVKDYGNMVSASVPFALCQQLEDGLLKEGDTVLLLGSAAGLTINALALQL
jgi:3-oxoacyl-[acyl-carrier-protein] synthase-3